MPDAAPLDPTEMFGEAWCITAAPLSVDETLARMNVPEPSPMPDGIDQATHRLENPASAEGVLLLAKHIGPGWTLVLEFDGTTGWVGMNVDILRRLSEPDQVAASIMSDPNKVLVMFIENGATVSELEPIIGAWSGHPSAGLADKIAAAGITEDGPVGPLADLTSEQAAMIALTAATGLALPVDALSDPWTGGIHQPG